MALGRSPSAGLANPWSEICIESATALGHYDAWCAGGPPPGRIGGEKAMGSSGGAGRAARGPAGAAGTPLRPGSDPGRGEAPADPTVRPSGANRPGYEARWGHLIAALPSVP